MKRVLFSTIAVAFLVGAEPSEAAKKELEKLEGEWTMAALEVNGKPVPEEKLRGTTLTIKGDKYIVATMKSKTEVTITLDPAKKPKEIDMAFPDGTNLPKIGKGIYKIEADTFVLVRSQSTDGARPTDFATTPDTGYFMVTWKRKGK